MGGYSSDSREGWGGLLVSLNVKGLVSTVRVGHWASLGRRLVAFSV